MVGESNSKLHNGEIIMFQLILKLRDSTISQIVEPRDIIIITRAVIVVVVIFITEFEMVES